MSFHTPAHKQITPAKTIADQIERIAKDEPQKLTFNQWALRAYPYGLGVTNPTQTGEMMEAAWNASRENI